MKIALVHHQLRGDARRTRLIGRERGYRGVGTGGTSVGGISNNRKYFGNLLPALITCRIRTTRRKWPFTGQPDWGKYLADDLERIVALHDASTIAAVIIEPVVGSTGVLVPPKGYLEKIRSICDAHGIPLISTRSSPGASGSVSLAADYFGIVPDLITTAKGLTNGAVPMLPSLSAGMSMTPSCRALPMIELFHGYTYSAHPLACAAAMATLDVFAEDDLFNRGKAMAPWENAIHGPGVCPTSSISGTWV